MIWEVYEEHNVVCISVEEVPIKPKVQMNYFLPLFTVAPSGMPQEVQYLGGISAAQCSIWTLQQQDL